MTETKGRSDYIWSYGCVYMQLYYMHVGVNTNVFMLYYVNN